MERLDKFLTNAGVATRSQIKAILKSFGVSKLTELPEDKYGQLMDEVSKL